MRRQGVVGHRGIETRRLVHRHGLPVVGPEHTWCDLAGSLSAQWLVALGDAVVNRWSGVPVEVLAEAVGERLGGRGAMNMRAALPLLRRGSRSPGETLTRLMFLDAGLPEPAAHDLRGRSRSL